MYGGSVHHHFNLKLTGMFSIHDCPKIEINNSRFGRNFIGDDTVHIVRSKAKISNSIFENSLADALDWDKVDGEIKNSLFLNTGTDGLDFNMGKVSIISSQFKNCGDSCFRASKGGLAIISDSNFKICDTALTVTDKSKVELSDSLISGCEIGYNSYRQEWRWEKGGIGFVKNTKFLNSIWTDITGDKYSRIVFQEGFPNNLFTRGKIKIISTSNQK